jgi:hypothetical protein
MVALHLAGIEPAVAGCTARRLLGDGSSAAEAETRATTLTVFAQRGPSTACTMHQAEKHVRWLIERLYTPPARRRTDPMQIKIPAPPADDSGALLALIILASRGRLRLAREHVIEVPELAALASYDPSSVRAKARHDRKKAGGHKLVRAGPNRHAPISEASATAFLRDVGVPPFASG